MEEVRVYGDWVGLDGPVPIGTLVVMNQRGHQTFGFTYFDQWLTTNKWPQLDPDLYSFKGTQYLPNEKASFGMLQDSAPDRWGRVLMQRKEALMAKSEDRKPRTLTELDYLLGVHDAGRLGGLRFKTDDDGAFLAQDAGLAAPPMSDLRQLMAASKGFERHEHDADEAKWINQLLEPGSSLGGARPKANVKDKDGSFWIAKFPSIADEIDKGGWEYLVSLLANRCGIITPETKCLRFGKGHHTFLSKRFDRIGSDRIHYASAMTLLGRTEGMNREQTPSYLDLAAFISGQGADPEADLHQLWRRIAFSIMVSNTDDHLRNHGFILTTRGWRLSPAFDINPSPDSKWLSLTIDGYDASLNEEALFAVAPQFRLKVADAKAIWSEMLSQVKGWESLAAKLPLPKAEIERLRYCFR